MTKLGDRAVTGLDFGMGFFSQKVCTINIYQKITVSLVVDVNITRASQK